MLFMVVLFAASLVLVTAGVVESPSAQAPHRAIPAKRTVGGTPDISREVRTCQVGYLPDESKWAMLTAAPLGPVVVRRASNHLPVFSVNASSAVLDHDSGDSIRDVDFSAVREAGRYYLDVPGLGRGDEFDIGPDVFVRPFDLVMQSFVGQRCGVEVALRGEFSHYRHAACHLGHATHHLSSGGAGPRDCHGGWHDAGDYGRYVVNSGITNGTLLWMYELFESKAAIGGANRSDSVAMPAVLAEIQWNLRWMAQMQDERDGGVWHKATSADFCGMVMPEDDHEPVLIVGSGAVPYKTTQATADLAANFAAAARIYHRFDPAYARRCLAIAERAWTWAIAHPAASFRNNPAGIITGGYTDHGNGGELLWAAAELYRTTGRATYHAYFLEHYRRWDPPLEGGSSQTWSDVSNLAMYAYALPPRNIADAETADRITRAALDAADTIVARVRLNGYRTPLRSHEYVWGSNSFVANYAMMLLMANRMSPRREYVDAALDAAHYLMGRNTFATSFITHVGSRWPQRPHHRPSMADGIDQAWPGLLVGGPNADNNLSPPARQWFDVEADYRTNEVAINWSAPLAFLLAAALPETRLHGGV